MTEDPYRKLARYYDRFVGPLMNGLRDIGMNLYPPKPGMKVLEVGCGTGTNLARYQRAGCLVCGIDRSPSMLAAAPTKLKNSGALQLGDASDLPYRKGSFDLVIVMFVLHEMPRELRPTAMREIIRVTHLEGRILIIDFHPNPTPLLRNWYFNIPIRFIERVAGRDHYRNQRDFLSQKGIPGLIENQNLVVGQKRIVGAGNIALFLMKPT